MNELPILDNTVFPFDARGVAKRFRHAAIFGALESLADGETMRFVNDHDPVPLLHQIQQRYGNQVGMAYVTREPVQLGAGNQPTEPLPPATGGCGGGGSGCGCSGGR